MFVDASAICAILMKEVDADDLLLRLVKYERRLTSPLAIWESALAIRRAGDIEPGAAHRLVLDFLEATGIASTALPADIDGLAIEAFERFGKGRHPAALNFGDCFAYACARHFRVPLLFKGEDFAQTDIELA